MRCFFPIDEEGLGLLKDKLTHVPEQPGSYQMLDDYGNIIYVGKAKNLKKRLTSYFTGSHDYKTQKMLHHVDTFEYIVTNSELEALILEIDLIKKHQPRFNILLTDDKSYPYIEMTREKHPKLIVTRPMNKTNRDLFGPYPNVKAARDTLHLLNKLYPLRKCGKLPNETCLYYHLGQCLAPCVYPVSPSTYAEIKLAIKRFLRGETRHVVNDLKRKMHDASDKLEFERAQEYKSMIEAIDTTTQRQSVNLDDLTDRDVIALKEAEGTVAIEQFFIRHGKIQSRDQTLIPVYLDKGQAVLDFLVQFYQAYPVPKELLSNEVELLKPLEALFKTTLKQPKRGRKKELLDLALLNAEAHLSEQEKIMAHQSEQSFGALDDLAEMLAIPTPYHIEAFDNSHLFGSHAVSAMVVFKNGRPDKSAYRKFKLGKDGVKQGDTEYMKEVIMRRYTRVKEEALAKPDLIIVDGGIHQLNAAKQTLANIGIAIPVVGLVKDTTHKTQHIIDQNDVAFELDANRALYALLAFIQEEAHRFAVSFHKKLRAKGVYTTVLDTIDGVGAITKNKLLQHFKTVRAMSKANYEDFKALNIPDKTIKNIQAALKKEG